MQQQTTPPQHRKSAGPYNSIEKKEEAVKGLSCGVPLKEVAASLNVDPRTVRRWIERSTTEATAWEDLSAENLRTSWRKHFKDGEQPQTTPVPAPSPDGVDDLPPLLQSRPSIEALSRDEAWAWFGDVERLEAVVEDPDDDDDEVGDVGGATTAADAEISPEQAWKIVCDYMSQFGSFDLDDIKRHLGDHTPVAVPPVLTTL